MMGNLPPYQGKRTFEDGVLFHKHKGQPVLEVPVPPAPLADTHGHFGLSEAGDPVVAVARAACAGVRLLVVPLDVSQPGDTFFDSSMFDERCAAIKEKIKELHDCGVSVPEFSAYPCLPDLVDRLHLCVGVHPYNAARFDDDCEKQMRTLLKDPRCVAVGEIGLDYTSGVEHRTQQEAFERQLFLAHDFDFPVELHIRSAGDDPDHRAHKDAYAILKRSGLPAAGCDIHCFTEGPDVAAPFVDLGCYFAFGGAVTFKKSDDIRAAACMVSSDRLLSETDCPFMTPEPLRGQECEPAMTLWSAECLARIRRESSGEAREETYTKLWENACRLFRISTGRAG